jgi:tellurite methyltransferase
MAYNYDQLYGTTAQALGAPARELVDFFKQIDGPPLRVLDIGCGQGRDALFIARLGHQVVGVDISPNGIRDLAKTAELENLKIDAIVADLTEFTPKGGFDILLIDRTLHMLPKLERLAVLGRLLRHVDADGWVLIVDERANLAGFKAVFAADFDDWKISTEIRGYLFVQRQ